MLAYGREIQSYKEQAVSTMTSGEMLVLLYEEIIKKLRKAELLAKQSDYANFDIEIKKAQNIVAYLKSSLDRSYEISKNLSRLYDFFNYQMIRLVAGRNLAIVEELIPLVADLRDAYKQADKLNKMGV